MITQVDEGLTAVGDTGWSPSSSCSKPSIVADMLDALDVHPGHSVLEIGTGTGWNAALLCQRVGQWGRHTDRVARRTEHHIRAFNLTG